MKINSFHARDEVIAGTISTFASFTILLSYAIFPQIRQLRFIELAFYVAINDFVGSIGVALGGNPTGSVACWIQGIATNAPYVSSVMWTAVISYQIWRVVHRKGIIQNMKYFHIICWGIPWVFTLLPLTTNTYGEADDQANWCFISNRADSPSWGILVWEILSFYGLLWIAVMVNFYLLFSTIFKISQSWEVTHANVKILVFKIAMYPIIISLCWSLATLTDLYSIAYPVAGATWSTANRISDILGALQGTVFPIIFYAINKEVVSLWQLKFAQCGCGFLCFALCCDYGIQKEDLKLGYAKIDNEISKCEDYHLPQAREGSLFSRFTNNFSAFSNNDASDPSYSYGVTSYRKWNAESNHSSSYNDNSNPMFAKQNLHSAKENDSPILTL